MPIHKHVIPCPAGEDFDGAVLADSSGHENEWDFRASFFCLGKGQCTVIFGQVVVGKNEVGREFLYASHKGISGHHPFRCKREPSLPQLIFHEFGTDRIVFKDQDVERLIHSHRNSAEELSHMYMIF